MLELITQRRGDRISNTKEFLSQEGALKEVLLTRFTRDEMALIAYDFGVPSTNTDYTTLVSTVLQLEERQSIIDRVASERGNCMTTPITNSTILINLHTRLVNLLGNREKGTSSYSILEGFAANAGYDIEDFIGTATTNYIYDAVRLILQYEHRGNIEQLLSIPEISAQDDTLDKAQESINFIEGIDLHESQTRLTNQELYVFAFRLGMNPEFIQELPKGERKKMILEFMESSNLTGFDS